jgi:hypothetical protein
MHHRLKRQHGGNVVVNIPTGPPRMPRAEEIFQQIAADREQEFWQAASSLSTSSASRVRGERSRGQRSVTRSDTHRRRHDSEDRAASTQGRSRILNLFVGVVAFTGGGKGTSESAAYEAVDLSHVDVVGPGSGEGIGHLFKGWDRSQKDYLQYRSAVIISAPEIRTLNA